MKLCLLKMLVGELIKLALENFQEESGHIRIPDALRPYMNGLEFLE